MWEQIFMTLDLVNVFLDMDSKVYRSKEKTKLDFIKIKRLWTFTFKKMKGHFIKWEKIFANHISKGTYNQNL